MDDFDTHCTWSKGWRHWNLRLRWLRIILNFLSSQQRSVLRRPNQGHSVLINCKQNQSKWKYRKSKREKISPVGGGGEEDRCDWVVWWLIFFLLSRAVSWGEPIISMPDLSLVGIGGESGLKSPWSVLIALYWLGAMSSESSSVSTVIAPWLIGKSAKFSPL